MDEMDQIRYRLRISMLEAKLALAQIEAAALAREIRSPLTSAQRRQQATDLRDAAHRSCPARLLHTSSESAAGTGAGGRVSHGLS
jgi:hypothetical protein